LGTETQILARRLGAKTWYLFVAHVAGEWLPDFGVPFLCIFVADSWKQMSANPWTVTCGRPLEVILETLLFGPKFEGGVETNSRISWKITYTI
jgi:hypothetical protein